MIAVNLLNPLVLAIMDLELAAFPSIVIIASVRIAPSVSFPCHRSGHFGHSIKVEVMIMGFLLFFPTEAKLSTFHH